MSAIDEQVEIHLRIYLERTHDIWNIYNSAMDDWLSKHPESDGAPAEGAFPEVGITHFNRHGCGIRFHCNNEIIEFDFIPKHVEKKGYLDIEEIDVYWSFVHFKSVHPDSAISEEVWNDSIDNLHQKGILTRFTWNRCAFRDKKSEHEIMVLKEL